ncbi:MAG: dihydrofolate reductase [Candidatus Saccharibacteria bacterium]|nr:dihydrofolate reductase [Candidatus Saccharibacteria bacterium]
MPDVKLIAAIDDKNGIAIGQKLPWKLPSDFKYFQDKIKEGPVVMGWNTFASNGFKPYGQGENIVITRRDTEAIPGVWIVHDAQQFFETYKKDVWVAGGGQIFKEALPYATHLYLTRVKGDFNSDIFFPEFEENFKLADKQPDQTENGILFHYEIWERKN